MVAGFGLAFAAGMISAGRLGDLYGRRRMFTVGLALFTVTSAACGLAPTAGFLDVARVLQGGAAAMMTPPASTNHGWPACKNVFPAAGRSWTSAAAAASPSPAGWLPPGTR